MNMNDSISTSVTIGLFPSLELSIYYHIFESKLLQFPLIHCRELNNFNPARLSTDPYPKENRPRGQKDLDSVLHHRKTICEQGCTEPIWISVKEDNYTLLDGVHRIVAAYLENKQTILAYIIFHQK
jgi:hypothetical protein